MKPPRFFTLHQTVFFQWFFSLHDHYRQRSEKSDSDVKGEWNNCHPIYLKFLSIASEKKIMNKTKTTTTKLRSDASLKAHGEVWETKKKTKKYEEEEATVMTKMKLFSSRLSWRPPSPSVKKGHWRNRKRAEQPNKLREREANVSMEFKLFWHGGKVVLEGIERSKLIHEEVRTDTYSIVNTWLIQ